MTNSIKCVYAIHIFTWKNNALINNLLKHTFKKNYYNMHFYSILLALVANFSTISLKKCLRQRQIFR